MLTFDFEDVTMPQPIATTKISTDDETDFVSMDKDEFIKKYDLPVDHIEFLDDLLMTSILFTNRTPFIAGGFLRRWIQGEQLGDMTCDVDMYCNGSIGDSDIRETIKKYITSAFGTECIDSDNGFFNGLCKIEYQGKIWDIQLMYHTFNFTDTMASISTHLNTYDSISSMIVYDHKNSRFVHHKDMIEHARNKIYDFNGHCRSVSPYTQFQRIKKFHKENYTMTPESDKAFLKWIIDNAHRLHDQDNYNV